MIFGILPGILEVVMISVMLVVWIIKTVQLARRAADGNSRQELKPRQRAFYGSSWFVGSSLFVACAVLTCINVNLNRELEGMVVIVYTLFTLLLIGASGSLLLTVWPWPRD